MRVYDLQDKTGRVYAFEVNNLFLVRRGACRVVRTIPNVNILNSPKLLSWSSEDVFCVFELSGQRFLILEPYGDNSRYWIEPEPPDFTELISVVREAFEHAGIFGIARRSS